MAMNSNECVTNINYDAEVRTTERFVAGVYPQNILESPIDGVLYFYLLYFHYL